MDDKTSETEYKVLVKKDSKDDSGSDKSGKPKVKILDDKWFSFKIEHEIQTHHHGWQYELGETLESNNAHFIILFLVFLDFSCVMAELVISLFENDCEKEELNKLGVEVEEPFILIVLKWVSVAILSIFILELILKLIAFGWRYFIKHALHAIDAIVVISSLFLILYLHTQEEREMVGLMIIFRFWRFLRIMDAVMIATTTKFEEKIEQLEEELKHANDTIRLMKAA